MAAAALSSAQGVRKLDSTALAEHLNAVHANASLQTLSLRHVGLTPNLAVQLADFLENNRSITEVDLTGNAIGSHGASCIAASLRKNDVMQRLILAKCGLKSDAVKPWAEYFQTTTTSEGSNQKTTLRYIDLSNNQIDDDAAAELGALVAATATYTKDGSPVELDLRRNWLGDDAIRSVATALQANHAIISLRLDGNQDEEAVVAKKQIAFCLQRNHRELRRRQTLQLITHIRESRVDLHECKLEYVDLSLQDGQFLSDALRVNRSLVSLSLRDNALPQDATRRILLALESHPSLRTLAIQDNDIGEIGFIAANRLVHRSVTLEELRIINSVQAAAPEQALLSQATLAALHHTLALDILPLRSIALVNCRLGDVEVGVIVSGIAWACCLQALELRNNVFTDHAVGVFVRVLERCSKLITLDVSGNRLSLDGASTVVHAAAAHPSIRTLQLGRVAQYDAPLVSSIIAQLRTSTTLVRVELSTKLHASRCAEQLEDLHNEWQLRRSAYDVSRRRDAARERDTHTRQARYRAIVRRFAIVTVRQWVQAAANEQHER